MPTISIPVGDIRIGQVGVDRWLEDERKRQEQPDDAIKLSLPYEPFPKQALFHQSTAKYRLFGGAAGPGKSHALLMEAVDQANRYSRAKTLLLRRTYEELEISILSKFEAEVPKELYAGYNRSKHLVRWHNGSVTRFGYCKLEKDIWRYQGGEFLFVGWDELTQFTLSQWQAMKGWNRSKVAPASAAGMAGATNPIGVGLGWVKALWVDKKPAAGMDENEARRYNPADYDYIPALLDDNPIYANDAEYRAALESMPTHLREALLNGRWDILAGVYFDIFDRASMVIRAEEIGMQPWWPRWIGGDWGFEHPSAVYWCTQSDEGVCYTYRELVVKHHTPDELIEQIAQRCKGEKIDAIYLPHDTFARRDNWDTIGDQMNRLLQHHKLPAAARADNDRVSGWMLMYRLLRNRQWLIADSCPRLIECLPTLVRDEKNVEDIAKMDGDDPADGVRYALKSRLAPRKPPLEQRVAAKMTSSDPTMREIQAERALAGERAKGRPFIRRPGRYTPGRRR